MKQDIIWFTKFFYRFISKEEFLGEVGKDHHKDRLSTDEKAEIAFKVFDKNHDGFITKGEMLTVSKNLTKEQVIFGIESHFIRLLYVSFNFKLFRLMLFSRLTTVTVMESSILKNFKTLCPTRINLCLNKRWTTFMIYHSESFFLCTYIEVTFLLNFLFKYQRSSFNVKMAKILFSKNFDLLVWTNPYCVLKIFRI